MEHTIRQLEKEETTMKSGSLSCRIEDAGFEGQTTNRIEGRTFGRFEIPASTYTNSITALGHCV
jgi:hypothetical protein